MILGLASKPKLFRGQADLRLMAANNLVQYL